MYYNYIIKPLTAKPTISAIIANITFPVTESTKLFKAFTELTHFYDTIDAYRLIMN